MNENKKTRILIDAHFLTGLPQGSRSYIIGLYKSIIKNYGSCYNVFACGHNKKEVLELLPIPEENYIQYKFNSSAVRLLFELPLIIKRNNIDFAHFQQISPLLKNCKHINTIHDLLFNEYPVYFSHLFRISRNILFKYSIKKSDIKLTVSEYSRKQMAKYYSIEYNSIYVTPNGVDISYFQEYDKQKVKEEVSAQFKIKKYILFVSRLEPRKNHAALLSAYLQMKLYENDIHLVFVGKKTAEDKSLDKIIAEIPAQAISFFHHFTNVNDEALLDLYRACDLFVYPSFAEGFGIPPLEAAAFGIPVLCSNQTAMADFGKLGLTMFNPNEHGDLERKINEMLNSNYLKNENLKNIKEKVFNQYSWDKSALVLHEQIQKNIK